MGRTPRMKGSSRRERRNVAETKTDDFSEGIAYRKVYNNTYRYYDCTHGQKGVWEARACARQRWPKQTFRTAMEDQAERPAPIGTDEGRRRTGMKTACTPLAAERLTAPEEAPRPLMQNQARRTGTPCQRYQWTMSYRVKHTAGVYGR